MPEEIKTDLSKFNMSQRILARIDNMQTQAAEYYIEGELALWFFEWKNVKFQIVGKLDEQEQSELKEKEDEIIKHIFNTPYGQVLKPSGVPFVEGYVVLIQTYIEEKDIGLVSKSDETTFT
mgnify:CR=1 FL=1|jgi:hypothetical protein|tara:strand:+ start:2201 stop:2563 length:363 start_codon:yes stop_codon:yes gene_type:complete